MSDWLLGIDAGGTGTQALLSQRGGSVRVAFHAGPCNWTTLPEAACAAALDSIARSVARELGTHPQARIVAVCLCSAGYHAPHHKEMVEKHLTRLWSGAQIRLETDLVAAWAGALEGETGIVLIAGTGSVAFGRTADGRQARAGGWGPVFGDEGSGYWLACRALAAVAAAVDGRGPATALGEAMRALARQPPQPDREWLRELLRSQTGRHEVAGMAPAVFDAAARGDEVADGLLRSAGAALGALVRAVERALGVVPTRWTWSGGLLTASATLQAYVAEWLESNGSHAEPAPPLGGPPDGALRLAETLI